MRIFLWRVLFPVFIFGSSFLGSIPARADQITLNPAFTETVINASESTKSFSISLFNESNAPVSFRVAVVDFGGLDESGGVAFLGADAQLEKKYALASWLRPETDAITLPAGEMRNISVTVENRDNLSPGGHYGAILFRREGNGLDMSDSPKISMDQILSHLVFVKKVGGERYQLSLVGVEMPKFSFTLPSFSLLRFQNDGNVHVVPRGKITLTDPFDREVGSGIINPESALVLPETFRSMKVSFRSVERLYFPGRYRYHITYRHSETSEWKEAFGSIDIFPPLATLGSLGTIVGIGWYATWRRRNTGELAKKKPI